MRRRDDLRELILDSRRRKRLRASRARRRRRAGVTAGLIVLAVVALLVAGGIGSGVALSAGCSLSTLRPVQIGQNSFLYAADGSFLGSIPAERNRQPVPLARMGRWLPLATVAVEDRRFYQHGGIDYVAIARALLRDVSAGKIVQGGSTITQQLVRNLYVGHEKTF